METESLSTYIKDIHSKISDLFGLSNQIESVYNRIDNRSLTPEPPKGMNGEPIKVCIIEDVQNISKRLTILTEKLSTINNNLDKII